jgi:O-antigen/teichoic acid export membrane protein
LSAKTHIGPLSLILRVGRSNVGSALAAIVVGVITARLLGPEGRGNYTLFVTTASLVSNVCLMGLYHAGVYFISKDRISPPQALGSVLLLAVTNLCVLAVAVPASARLLGSSAAVFGGFWIGTCLVAACVILVLRDGLGGIVMALKHYAIYTDQLILEPLCVLLATLMLFVVTRSEQNAIFLRTGGSALALVVMSWRVLRTVPLRPELSLAAFRQEIVFGVQAVAQGVLYQLNFRIYIYFLAGVSAAATGWFSISLLFGELVRFVPIAVGGALFPFMSGETPEVASRMAATASRHIFAVGLVVALGFALLGSKITALIFGAAFLPSVTASTLTVAGAVIGTLYLTLTGYFTGVGRQGVIILAAAGGLVVGIAVAAVAVPRWGVTGAGIAYLASSIVASGFTVVRFSQLTGYTIRSVLVLTAEDVGRLIDGSKRYMSRFRAWV